MIEQDAKKELYSYLHSKKLEERKLEQIEEQKTKLTKITSILSDMPKGTPDHDKMSKNIAILLDLIRDHIKIMEDEEENLIRITKKINKVEQPYRNILELRFVKGMKVEEVSVELDRDYRYTKKLIKKSIKKYAEL
jgi:DNA-directed RNA polymerase specialized sigma24 family protein